jgi:hypothetical protein
MTTGTDVQEACLEFGKRAQAISIKTAQCKAMAQEITQDALSLATDVHTYGDELLAKMPPSEGRDELVRAVRQLESAITELAAVKLE